MIDRHHIILDLYDKLYNLYDEECYDIISRVLEYDLKVGHFDYRPFLLDKMNARSLMEIRNSYLVPWKKEEDRKNIPIVDDPVKIKDYRDNILRQIVEGYQGYYWQLYILIKFGFKSKNCENLEINFDSLYTDTFETFDGLMGEQYYMDCWSVTRTNKPEYTKYMEDKYMKQGLKFRIR